jgi:hypothetical protein
MADFQREVRRIPKGQEGMVGIQEDLPCPCLGGAGMPGSKGQVPVWRGQVRGGRCRRPGQGLKPWTRAMIDPKSTLPRPWSRLSSSESIKPPESMLTAQVYKLPDVAWYHRPCLWEIGSNGPKRDCNGSKEALRKPSGSLWIKIFGEIL